MKGRYFFRYTTDIAAEIVIRVAWHWDQSRFLLLLDLHDPRPRLIRDLEYESPIAAKEAQRRLVSCEPEQEDSPLQNP